MKATGALVIVGAFTLVLAGMWAISQVSDDVGAAPGCPPKCPTPSPAPPQPHQGVISLLAVDGTNLSGPPAGTWIEINTPGNVRLPLNAANYPANTTFRLELAGTYGGSFPAVTVCLRLSDVVSGAVAGSDACVAPAPGAFSVSSPTFTLPGGAHTYKVEISGESNLVTTGVRLVAEWNE